jgi:hypothetical protein
MQPLIAISLALYTALLGLYPRAFRREFATDMIQDFEEASHEAWTNTGWRGLLSFAFFAGADVARGVLMQWLRSGRLLVMLILVTTVVVIIAATVIFSLMFLRPALNRHAGRRRV